MNERKILDMTMEDGQNVSVFMLNEDSDDATLIYIEKDMSHYSVSTSDNLNDFVLSFFELGSRCQRIDYISDDTFNFLNWDENIDCLNDNQVSQLHALLSDYLENEVK